MRSLAGLLFTVVLCVTPPARAEEAVPGQALLRLSGSEDPDRGWKDEVTKLGRSLDVPLEPVRRLPLGWRLVRFDVGIDPRDVVTALLEHPAVAAASPDWWMRAQLRPDDDDLDAQWSLQVVRAEEAWDVTTGAEGRRIGIVDSGVRRDHRDLQDRSTAGYDFVSDPALALDGDGRDPDYEDDFDQAECGGADVDGDFHGTAVAGVIGAHTDNGRALAGLDWRADLVVARALGACGQAATSDVLDAVAWLAGLPVDEVPPLEGGPVHIVNLSFGHEGPCGAPEQELVDHLVDAGIWLVAPTGNGVPEVMSPARCEGVVAVGAHGPGEGRPLAAYSASSGPVDLVAPGGDLGVEDGGVLALSGDGRNATARREGTSLAAAHVTGAISLITAAFAHLTRRQVLEALASGGAPCEGCGATPALDLAAALAAAAAAPVLGGPGDPCSPSAPCDAGLACAGVGDEGAVCRSTCGAQDGAGCDAAQLCLPLEGLLGEAACFPEGPIEAGGPCQRPVDCVAGTVCVQDPSIGVGVCRPQCNHGYTCPVGALECVALNPFQSYCAPEAKPEPEPEPEPPDVTPPLEAEPDGRCRLELGNLDCRDDLGCLEDHDGDGVGFCGPWTGARGGGARCADRYACASGVCEAGLCLYACEEGACAPGWTCGAEGLCRPAGCPTACGEGFACEDVDGQRHCVRPEGGCTTVTAPRPTRPPWAAGLLVLPLLARRPRRCRDRQA